MGLIPEWVKAFPGEFWNTITGKEPTVQVGQFRTGFENWASNVGTGVKETVEPILSGVRKALSPSIIWILVIATVLLIFWSKITKLIGIK